MSVGDFKKVLSFMESHKVEFYNERIATVFLEQDQKKVDEYNPKAHFVFQKMSLGKKTHIREMNYYDRQHFYEFEQVQEGTEEEK